MRLAEQLNYKDRLITAIFPSLEGRQVMEGEIHREEN